MRHMYLFLSNTPHLHFAVPRSGQYIFLSNSTCFHFIWWLALLCVPPPPIWYLPGATSGATYFTSCYRTSTSYIFRVQYPAPSSLICPPLPCVGYLLCSCLSKITCFQRKRLYLLLYLFLSEIRASTVKLWPSLPLFV